mmetsp:Transcript_75470/g.125831  ORF Transcript_75470/g.125831 Transcript_75470/m.125831 type:complete len:179 (-) Transcript_75470:105-641(-)
MSARAWAASAFDVSVVPEDSQRKGLYARDQVSNKRDPSGPSVFIPPAHHFKYPSDHDIIYATAQTPVPRATLPELPSGHPVESPQSTLHTYEGRPTTFGSSQYIRRGTRVGDIGWGCFTVNTGESAQNGLRDGHAYVGMDLDKKHQFMNLPGDPCFDKRAGSVLLNLKKAANGRPLKR